MSAPNIRLRGLRSPGVPSGYVLGRTATGAGEVQLLKLSDLQTLGVASRADVPILAPPIAIKNSGGVVDPAVSTLEFDGAVVTTDGSHHTIVTISSGAGISPFSDQGIVKPVAANFTLAQQTGTTSTLANLANRGIVLNVTGSGGDTLASVEQAVLSQTAFTAIAMLFPASSLDGNWFVGIGVKDNTGKYVGFGWRNNGGQGTFNNFKLNSINSVNSASNQFGLFNPNSPMWLKVQLTGGNFIFSAAFDGETYETIGTFAANAFLGATLSSVGFFVDNNSSHHMIIDCFSWQQTTP